MISHEKILHNLLTNFFPKTPIHQNVRKITNLKYPETGAYMEFDIWIPEHKLAFEFQDAYHFVPSWYYHNTQQFIQQRDIAKFSMARKNEIHLIAVPCWWQGSPEMLAATIDFYCPDILLNNNNNNIEIPISVNPPKDFFETNTTQDVGELMLASFPTNKFTVEPGSQWWMGEKYDGWRCCWNPFNQKPYTRYGNEIPLHSSLFKFMPPMFLDTELWFGRGQYATTFYLAKETASTIWHQMRMVTFDEAKRGEDFETRYSRILQAIQGDHPFNVLTWRIKGETTEIVENFLKLITSHEGEGLIVQRSLAFYQPGRSSSVFKLKAVQGDQEAMVTGFNDDRSVNLKLPNSRMLRVPPERVQVNNYNNTKQNNTIQNNNNNNNNNNKNRGIKIGDIVTIEDASGSPRKAIPSRECTIVRIRSDLSWNDVLHGFRKNSSPNPNDSHRPYSAHQAGFWNTRNMKAFLVEFAKNRNLLPHVPETWYSLFSEFRKSKNGRTILRKFKKNPFSKMLQQLFPGMNIDPTRLHNASKWNVTENRRIFFEKYAKMNAFDALVPENWYKQSKKSIFEIKGAQALLSYHQNSVAAALIDLFPEINFIHEKFLASNLELKAKFLDAKRINQLEIAPNNEPKKPEIKQSKWSNIKNRKLFFENYARQHRFSSVDPELWHLQSKHKLLATKGIDNVLEYHNNSVSTALLELFPDIGLDHLKLPQD